jgi:exopolysaccharide production protein ExoZ
MAAMAVATAHAQADLTQRAGLIDALPNLEWCKAGVDVFFVVSGFIMVYSSESLFGKPDGPRTFFTRRLVRIIPLYWLVTTIYIATAAFVPALQHKNYSSTMMLASYLFIPVRSPDGLVEPIVGQGWTLNYEMLFYLAFALSVTTSRRTAVSIVTLVLVSAVWAGKHFAPLLTVFDYWSNEIILEFVLGILLGLAYQEGVRLPRPIRILLVGTGLLLLYTHSDFATNYRSANWGVPAAMIVAGTVFGAPTGPSAGWRWLMVTGNASYALYLIHSLPIRAVRAIWTWLGLGVRDAPWVYLFVALAIATVTAVVVHFCVERPMSRWCRAVIAPRNSKKVSLSSTSVAS